MGADLSSKLALAAGWGHTTRDLARRWRVSEDRVRAWIKAGELYALNTAATRCGRPRYVVTPEAIAEFEARRQAAAPASKARRRRKKSTDVDYYP